MKRRHLTHRPVPPTRPPRGFTLIELLVVIGLIIFLVGMTVSVVSGVITTSREKATKATIKKIDGLLTQRMEAFTMALKAQKLTGTNSGTVQRKKILFRSSFPQTLKEAGLATSDDPTDVTASSEALYEFLVNGETFGAPAVDTDAFSSSEVQDTDGDGRMEFMDGWDRPLRFYRWPTRLIRPAPEGQESEPQSYDASTTPPGYVFKATGDYNKPNETGYDASLFFGSLPTELDKDPDDPLGRINHQTVDVKDFEANFHTPETWSLPLIVSAGADGILGLYEPVDKENFGHLAQPEHAKIEGILDNRTNRNMLP